MKTLWNDMHEIEKYLLKQLSAEESLVFQAKLITNPALQFELYLQKKIHAILKIYHRKKLKEEAETVHNKLFNDSKYRDFQQEVFQFFKN